MLDHRSLLIKGAKSGMISEGKFAPEGEIGLACLRNQISVPGNRPVAKEACRTPGEIKISIFPSTLCEDRPPLHVSKGRDKDKEWHTAHP